MKEFVLCYMVMVGDALAVLYSVYTPQHGQSQ